MYNIKNSSSIRIVIFVCAILLLVGCKDEIVYTGKKTNNNSNKKQVISVVAEMPSQNTTTSTRISLDRQDNLIALTWEDGDKIQLLFHQEGTPNKNIKQEVTILEENISKDRIKAQFDIVVPDDIVSGFFTLYGVYGGGGLMEDDPTKLALTSSHETDASLDAIEKAEHMVLHFSLELDASNMQASYPILFNHLGSFFNVRLTNNSSNILENIDEVRLTSTVSGWIYNNSVESYAKYDLVTGEFLNTGDLDSYISFKSTVGSFASGETYSYYSWHPILPEQVTPEINLELRFSDGTASITTLYPRPAKDRVLSSGKNYIVDAAWDGTNLEFTDLVPRMTFATAKETAGTVIRVDAAPEDRAGVWIDFNNNGIMDIGEKVHSFASTGTDNRINYTARTEPTFTIYGKVLYVEIYSQQITSADLTRNPFLEQVFLQFNNLTEIDVSNNPYLSMLQVGGQKGENKITEIDLSNNNNLMQAQVNGNHLTSIIPPSSSSSFYILNANNNNLSESSISSIIDLLPNRNDLTQGTFHVTKAPGNNQSIPAHQSAGIQKNWKVNI